MDMHNKYLCTKYLLIDTHDEEWLRDHLSDLIADMISKGHTHTARQEVTRLWGNYI